MYKGYIPIIWRGFTWPVIMSLVHGISTLTKHGKWSYKSLKRDWPCILHGHSQSCYWECRTDWISPESGQSCRKKLRSFLFVLVDPVFLISDWFTDGKHGTMHPSFNVQWCMTSITAKQSIKLKRQRIVEMAYCGAFWWRCTTQIISRSISLQGAEYFITLSQRPHIRSPNESLMVKVRYI